MTTLTLHCMQVERCWQQQKGFRLFEQKAKSQKLGPSGVSFKAPALPLNGLLELVPRRACNSD